MPDKNLVKGFTLPLVSDTYEITEAKNIVALSLFVVSGTCNLTGGDKIDGQVSEPISLPTGTPFTVTANNGVLDGYTIQSVGGTTLLVLSRSN